LPIGQQRVIGQQQVIGQGQVIRPSPISFKAVTLRRLAVAVRSPPTGPDEFKTEPIHDPICATVAVRIATSLRITDRIAYKTAEIVRQRA
jgi:hypothetical protein